MRYFLRFSYFGTAYHGWQRQPNAITVQEVLEDACSTLLRQTIVLVGAGRTDTGVHAKQMYAHFNLTKTPLIPNFIHRLNAFLPEDIAVQGIYEVPGDAHARFNATARTYEYWLIEEKNPFYKDAAHLIKKGLNIPAMNEASELLLQHKDFECFSRSNTDVKTFFCQVSHANWKKEGALLVFTITADRFLRNMVRAVVGTLLEIGTGKATLEDMKKILKSKNRSEAGPSAPAKGLYLTRVDYPNPIRYVNE